MPRPWIRTRRSTVALVTEEYGSSRVEVTRGWLDGPAVSKMSTRLFVNATSNWSNAIPSQHTNVLSVSCTARG